MKGIAKLGNAWNAGRRAFASTKRRMLGVATVSALVALPLLGFPFRADERFAFYADSARFGANPFRIVSGALDEVGFFIGRGNFRPLGRMLDYFEHSLALEIAVSTGASLPAVHGIFRLLAIGLIGVAGMLSLVGLQRAVSDDGFASRVLRTAIVLYPLVFGVAAVAGGPGSPLTLFPFLYLTTTALPVLAALWVGRSQNLVVAKVGVAGAIGYVCLGAVLASTFDLVYLAMPLMLAYAAIQVTLSSYRFREVTRLRVFRVVAWTAAGFSAVFVPTRLLIQQACSGGACYAASDLSFDPSGLAVFVDRLAAGFPPAGWHYVNDLIGTAGIGWKYFLGNAGGSFVAAGLLIAGFLVARSLRTSWQSDQRSSALAKRSWATLGLVALWPVAVLAGGSLLAALSAKMQSDQPPIGFAWRDSGFAAIAWAILLSLVLAILVEVVTKRHLKVFVGITVIALLVFASGRSYLNNASLAESASRDPESIVNNRIALEVVDFDLTELGNERRCQLLSDFSEVFHDRQYERDVQLAGVLNWVSEKRYKVSFCDS